MKDNVKTIFFFSVVFFVLFTVLSFPSNKGESETKPSPKNTAHWVPREIGFARTYTLKADNGNSLMLYCFEKEDGIHYTATVNNQPYQMGTVSIEDGYLTFLGTEMPISELLQADEIEIQSGNRDSVIFINHDKQPNFKFDCRGN